METKKNANTNHFHITAAEAHLIIGFVLANWGAHTGLTNRPPTADASAAAAATAAAAAAANAAAAALRLLLLLPAPPLLLLLLPPSALLRPLLRGPLSRPWAAQAAANGALQLALI